MGFIPSNDIEAIDRILKEMQDANFHSWVDDKYFATIFDSSYLDFDRISRKMKKLDLFVFNEKIPSLYRASDFAREIISEHKSYSNYISSTLSAERKKDKAVIFDRVIKNGNIIAALIISAFSLILSQIPKDSSKEQQQIKEDLQSSASKLDTLQQGIQRMQKSIDKLSAKDTGINK